MRLKAQKPFGLFESLRTPVVLHLLLRENATQNTELQKRRDSM